MDHTDEILTSESPTRLDGPYGLVTIEYDDGDSYASLYAQDGDGNDTQVWLKRENALQLMLALAAFVKQA